MVSQTAQRTADEIARLCAGDLDTVTLRRRLLQQLSAAVPYDAYCCGTIDPLTMLITSEVAAGIPAPAFQIAAENEYLEPDVNKFDVLARSSTKSAVLSHATAGHPAKSPRYRSLVEPFGFGPELRVAFVDQSLCWGGLTLFRHRNQPEFTRAEARFVSRLSSRIAAGLRAALVREAPSTTSTNSPGIVVLDDRLQVEAITPEAEHYLTDLRDKENASSATLPRAVYEVASRARALTSGGGFGGPPARLRVRTTSGVWLILHGSRLTSQDQAIARTAVVIEVARPLEVVPLIVQAYGFSPGEQKVIERVLSGASTAETARALALSPYTVGDYLKVIFDRIGVRSQRELIAHFLGEPGQTDPSQSALAYGQVTQRVVFGQ